MGKAVDIRTDFTSGELRSLARKSKDTAQSRRLLSLAAVLDGMNRTDAATIGGMVSIGIKSGPLIGAEKGPLWRDGSWPEAA